MHHTASFALISVAMASHSAIIEAPDDACGYLNGMEQAPFGCHNPSEKCAIYYPTSSMAAPSTLLPMITPAPQPSVVCYEPSQGDCTVQPTACVDNFRDCTGTCSIGPLTLKCSSHLYCNRAHFESPLSYRNIMAMDSGLRSTVAPADGWFCGPPPSPVQQGDASHNKTTSMAHIISSPVSVTTTLDVTITLSQPGPALGSSVRTSVSPTTTLSVTITLSRPGQTPGPSPSPSPLAATVPEDTDCENGTHSGDDCCPDEQDTAEAQDPASRGSAIVSTTYTGQTNRLPLMEATRPWNVVIPTAVATADSRPRNGKKNRLNVTGIICGSISGFFIILFVYWVWRRKLGQRGRCCENNPNHTKKQLGGHPGLALGTDPAPRRHPHPQIYLRSNKATADDVDEPAPRSVSSLDSAPQSEGSEREAYENIMGFRGLEESNRASNMRMF